jgi:hypothetical protein
MNTHPENSSPPRTGPIFTMQSLGRNGRFANQLFQYLFMRIAADRRGGTLQTPSWIGQDIFGLKDPPITNPGTTVVKDEEITDPDLYLNSDRPIGDHLEFWGWFQFHSRHYRPHRDFIRKLFILHPELRHQFDGVIEQLRALKRPIVAVHLRRGDYGKGYFFRAPALWYADWLREQEASLPNPIVYLCSETPQELMASFAPWQVLHSGLLPQLPPALAFLLDFYVMIHADALAISNSSFSFMAAMLNERAGIFARPTLKERRLVAFDPWDAPVLFTRRIKPGEQEELDGIDIPGLVQVA